MSHSSDYIRHKPMTKPAQLPTNGIISYSPDSSNYAPTEPTKLIITPLSPVPNSVEPPTAAPGTTTAPLTQQLQKLALVTGAIHPNLSSLVELLHDAHREPGSFTPEAVDEMYTLMDAELAQLRVVEEAAWALRESAEREARVSGMRRVYELQNSVNAREMEVQALAYRAQALLEAQAVQFQELLEEQSAQWEERLDENARRWEERLGWQRAEASELRKEAWENPLKAVVEAQGRKLEALEARLLALEGPAAAEA